METKLINESVLASLIKEEINEAMLSAAEPAIQEALKTIEQKMREQMGSKIISLIDSNFVLDRMGHDIRILIKQAKP